MVNLVGKMINQIEPHFNAQDAGLLVERKDGRYEFTYYNQNRNEGDTVIFARYDEWTKTLRLNNNIYETLQKYFGEWESALAIIDWFNEEFSRDAENIAYV